ncbi:hypothetical protein [Azospirillum sp. ST 5-10]|uniref:hypothetical protein n=1 Tax=unclassified Azospirillum TaxID=2630922 RepID=UPI003F4A1213
MGKVVSTDELFGTAGKQAAPKGRVVSTEELFGGSPAPAEAPARPPASDGLGLNAAAGANDFIASALGAPADAVNALFGGADWLYNQVVGSEGRHLSTDAPIGGSASIRRGMSSIGIANPDNVEAQTFGERLARGAGAGVAGAVVPWAGARAALGSAVDTAAASIPGAIARGLAAGGPGTNAAIGAAGGLGATAAGDAAGEGPLRPLAELAGGLAGGVAGGLAASGAGSLASSARALRPGMAGRPSGTEEIVAETLRRNAKDPGTLVDRLSQPAELVPGSMPTTAQMVGDTNLLTLERGVSRRSPTATAAFLDRQATQNAAQTAALEGLAPEGAVPRVAEDVTAHGGRLRTLLQAAKSAEKARLGNLYAGIDPEGALALDITPVKTTVRQLVADLPKASALGATERRLLETVQGMPDVEAFRQIQALQSELKGAIRAERATGGDTRAVRRMSILLGLLDDAIGRGGRAADDAAPTPVAAPSDATGPAPAVGNVVYTETAGPLPVRFALVEGDTLRPATGDLQPRDRGRAASDAMIAKTARELNPGRLGASAELGSGAPIVRPDGTVIDGNGRYRSIMMAHSARGQRSADYRAWLKAQGFDPEGMRNPVLVRLPEQDLSPDQWRGVAREANAGRGMAYSAPERAALDADRLGGDVLDLYRGGPLDAPENREFVRAFAGKLDPTDVNSFADRQGRLSVDGRRRLQGAALRRAYDNPQLVSSLLDTGDDNIRALGRALTDAAPAIAKLRAAIERGDVGREMDPAAAIAEAVRLVQRARSSGIPLGDVVANADAFNPLDPLALEFLTAAYGPNLTRVSASRATAALTSFADEAAQAGAAGQMFGGASALDVMRGAARRAGDGGVAPDAQPPMPETAPPRTDPSVMPQQALEPNFGPEDAARYRGANEQYRQFAERFKGGQVGNVLASDRVGGWRVADADVAARFFNTNRRSVQDIQALVQAVGDPERAGRLLADYAADTLRTGAMNPDGSLDVNRFSSWLQRHGEALRAVDALAGGNALRPRVGGDAGLRRAVLETIKRTLRSTGEAGDTGLGLWSADRFQRFVANNRPALELVFDRQQLDTMEAVATDLRRMQRSVTGSRLGGGSDTAQNAAAMADLPGTSTFLGQLLGAMGRAGGAAGGAAAGALTFGPWGAVAGVLGAEVLRAGRASVQQRIDDLLTSAMLNPDVARALLTRVPPGDVPPSMAAQMRNALVKGGLLGAVEASRPDDRDALVMRAARAVGSVGRALGRTAP